MRNNIPTFLIAYELLFSTRSCNVSAMVDAFRGKLQDSYRKLLPSYVGTFFWTTFATIIGEISLLAPC